VIEQTFQVIGTVLGDKFRGINSACTPRCSLLGSYAYKMEMDATANRGVSENEAKYLDLSR